MLESYNSGNPALMQQGILACEEAIAADGSLLQAYFVLGHAHRHCHLLRWGDRPDQAIERAWQVVERMTAINAQDERTLTLRGWSAVSWESLRRFGGPSPRPRNQSEQRAGADLTGCRRGWHGTASRRRGTCPASIAAKSSGLLDRQCRSRTCDGLLLAAGLRRSGSVVRTAIQLMHRTPIRRALMIACSARAGEHGARP